MTIEVPLQGQLDLKRPLRSVSQMRAPHVKDKCGCKMNSVSGGEGAQEKWEGAQIHL